MNVTEAYKGGAEKPPSDAKITKVECVAVRAPLDDPVWAPGLLIEARDYILVVISCEDGSRGIGFSYIGTGGGISALAAMEELVAPRVIGKPAGDIEEIYRDLMKATRIQGRGGLVMNAISAIDIALWDMAARREDKPLWAYLGASEELRSVPTYASGGYLFNSTTKDPLEDELKRNVDAGFDSLKIKCGFGTLQEDLARVHLAREIVGPDRTLFLDAYNSWSTLDEVLPHVEGYLAVDPGWIEDPFEPDALHLYKALKPHVASVPLATGEFYFGTPAFQSLADARSVGVFQAEAPRCGGVTGWLKIADIAAAANIRMDPCWFHEMHLHLVAACEHADIVELFPDESVLNFSKLIDQPPQSQGGRILLPQRPGLGFDFDEDAITRYRIGSATCA